MTKDTATLDTYVLEFLSSKSSFEEFQRAYSTFFIDEIPETGLSSIEIEFYGAIHEKAEWTTLAPTMEERKYGWMTPTEFKEWLTGHEESKPHTD